MRQKRFALIGAAGYIAPRHMYAIEQTGNELWAAMDISDSVGVLDHYFPQAKFFTDYFRFERHLEDLRRRKTGIDYLVVCTPNYMHDAHIRLGLRLGAHVICEKPVTITPDNLVAVIADAYAASREVYTTLPLRCHKPALALPDLTNGDIFIEQNFIRGHWYDYSWKGNEEKSGGILFNLGIHLIDLMVYRYGKMIGYERVLHGKNTASGTLFLERAKVRFLFNRYLSGRPARKVVINNQTYDLPPDVPISKKELHLACYNSILAGETKLNIVNQIETIKVLHEIKATDSQYRRD